MYTNSEAEFMNYCYLILNIYFEINIEHDERTVDGRVALTD
jgi:hypothetical protein